MDDLHPSFYQTESYRPAAVNCLMYLISVKKEKEKKRKRNPKKPKTKKKIRLSLKFDNFEKESSLILEIQYPSSSSIIKKNHAP